MHATNANTALCTCALFGFGVLLGMGMYELNTVIYLSIYIEFPWLAPQGGALFCFILLALYIAQHVSEFASQRLLDLGAGS